MWRCPKAGTGSPQENLACGDGFGERMMSAR